MGDVSGRGVGPQANVSEILQGELFEVRCHYARNLLLGCSQDTSCFGTVFL
jgi:hypothetical protein